MKDYEIERLRESLTGDVEPLRLFGVTLGPIPWWRRRIQRYVMPRRFQLWAQTEILNRLEETDTP